MMGENILALVTTTMEPKDFKKYLYLITFKRNQFYAFVIAVVILAASALQEFIKGDFSFDSFNIVTFLVNTAIYVVVVLVATLVVTNLRANRMIRENKSGAIGTSKNILFYDFHIEVKVDTYIDKIEKTYEDIKDIVVNKDYVILYFNDAKAVMMRQCDMEEPYKILELLEEKAPGKIKGM